MKPAPFKYVRAESQDAAVAALGEYGDSAKVLAGGQSLLTLMNLRVAQPECLVDIGPAGLDGIVSRDLLEIGATTTQTAALRSDVIATSVPLLQRALRDVGHHTLRNRGTVGGSIAHADPAAELPAVLVALGGEVVAVSARETRIIDADEFFLSHFTTALREDELLTTVRISLGADTWAFHEIARRHGDFALAGVAATFERGSDGMVSAARVVFFSVGERPTRLPEVEAALVAHRIGDPAATEDAARLAAEAVEPVGDLHGSTALRKRLTGVALKRAIADLVAREGNDVV